MKKLTNKQRCRNCIHRTVCKYFGAYDGLEWLGDRCKHYKPRNKKEERKSNTKAYVRTDFITEDEDYWEERE